MTPLNYFEDYAIIANTLNQDNAAFKRFKKGVRETYRVIWVSHDRTRCEARRVRKDGQLDNHYYIFNNKDLAPIKFFEKKLEDYL